MILDGEASDLAKELSLVPMKGFTSENDHMNASDVGYISHNMNLLYQKYHTTHSPHYGSKYWKACSPRSNLS
jgi:hypothetical protein